MSSEHEIVVDGRHLRISHPEKVLYPATGFTKGQMVDYYRRIAPVMLPHLRGRTVTLKRYPDGVEGQGFFTKHCPEYRPSWLRTVRVEAENEGGEVLYCVIEDAAALIWLANLATIELHVSLARAEEITRPTSVVFDLDPGAPASIIQCAEVALRLRDACQRLGLAVYPKLSGSKGLHVHIPLNTPTTYAQTKPWARAMAEHLMRTAPKLVVANMRRRLRRGRVLVDWSQNDEHKTTVSVYSLRARHEPSVSAPLRWEEVERIATDRSSPRMRFGPEEILHRVADQGELLADLLTIQQRLPTIDVRDAA